MQFPIFLLAGILSTACAMARSPQFAWAQTGGGADADNLFGFAVSPSGIAHAVGQFQSTAQFGTNTLMAAGPSFSDIFVAKYDRSGSVIWVRQAGGTNEDYASAVAVNELGDVYLTGAFRSVATFGETNATSNGIEDIFLAKYDSEGNLKWLRNAGGSGHDFGTAITTRGTDGCYVTGVFQSTVSFPGTNLTSQGVYDVFLAKYDAAGNLLWVRSVGGNAEERSLGVATDEADNAIITGYFASAFANFGDLSLTNQNPPYSDAFLAKYDSVGHVLWVRRIGSDDSERGVAVTASGDGEIWVAGTFASSNIVLASVTLTNRGNRDVFLIRCSPTGGVLWAREAGGIADDSPEALVLDSGGNCYLAGSFAAVAQFGSIFLTNSGVAGTLDAFVCHYDRSGNVFWAIRAGGDDDDFSSGIGVDLSGNNYVGGSFYSAQATFGDSGVTNSGVSDFFLAQIEFLRPELAISSYNNKVLLSWPTDYAGFALQSAGDFDSGSTWTNTVSLPITNGGRIFVTNSTSQAQQFFRLHHP